MASRDRYSSATVGDIAGDDFLDQYAGHVDTIYDASCFPLTSVGGTGDAVTAALDPALDAGGFADGMRFTLTWGAANTGAVTLAINGGSALAVLDKSGAALVAGDLSSGLRSMIEYVGGSFRILTEVGGTAAGGVAASYQAFTASGTWTKPAGIADDQMVVVELWGGGGGGGRGSSSASGTGGGGGGGYVRRAFRAADLPSTVSVTIGQGGLGRTGSNGAGTAGGNSTFGALLTAYGGGGGAGNAAGQGRGGGGGGELEAGTTGTAGGTTGLGGAVGGADGGIGVNAGRAGTIWGGGGGNSGKAVFGGGGGGTDTAGGDGGVSLHGGNGGDGGDGSPVPTSGSAPGGGGGGGSTWDAGNGARGECRVWIMGA
ncbi:hypothetical protein OEW28_18600 [Defluviimonas sp. WL0002]|uniref:Glycine-rich domain-containing protein n=1 Tax=Albidovulum marisflavi TaxID=2984159 RepID=A0ABT2ZHN3_9RHOB|nr:hypothetical protein [Defluviimonas sp. WL0002]MCV2870627.1 hypothetical protein [Defluviimonas sp. WL0002]